MELLNKRSFEENIFKILMAISLSIVVGSLIIIIFLILYNGASSLSIEMITQSSSGGYYLGKSGGIFNAIFSDNLSIDFANLFHFSDS